MTDFDYGAFLDVTSQIEKYLGYLKGNETVADYFEEQLARVEASGAEQIEPMSVDYQTTPAEGDLVVDFNQLFWVGYAPGGVSPELREWADQLVAGARQSWDNGCAWADGLAHYLRGLCADLTRPDAALLRETAQQFSEARIALEGALPVDWTDLDFTSWIGGSSDACSDVTVEFHAVVRAQYLTYFAHAQTIFAGAGALAVQSQAGLVPTLEDVRAGLRDQLAAWARADGRPTDFGGLDPRVPEIYDIASEIVDLIPAVGDIKALVEDVGGTVDSILGLFGVDPELTAGKPFDATSAEQVYDQLTELVETTYLRPLDESMQRIGARRSQPIIGAQGDILPWFMPTLDGIVDETWQHEVEA